MRSTRRRSWSPIVRSACVGLAAAALAACAEDESIISGVIAGGDREQGRVLIGAMGCGACHVVPGVRGAVGLVGPPLTNFGRRQYIAGRLVNEPENLVAWIVDPQAIDSLTAMPTLGLDSTQARDIAAYLLSLGAGSERPAHLLPASWLEGLRSGH